VGAVIVTPRATPPGQTTVTCACGQTQVVVEPGITITNLRCTFCPPEKPRPKLTLVKT